MSSLRQGVTEPRSGAVHRIMSAASRDSRAARPASGRPTPFDANVLSFIDNLYGTAMRLTRNPADAEDLVQDTYVKAFRFSDRFQPGTNLKAWLFTILHNTFRNDIRHAGRDPIEVDSETVEQTAAPPGQDASPEQILLRATLDADLQSALDGLPAAFRQAVWLRDVEEFSYRDIGEILSVPQGTVMSRISRGRQLLLRQLVDTPVGVRRTGSGR